MVIVFAVLLAVGFLVARRQDRAARIGLIAFGLVALLLLIFSRQPTERPPSWFDQAAAEAKP